jgi:hypothetical protein
MSNRPFTAILALQMHICTQPECNARKVAKASRQTKFFSARAISLHTVDIPSIRGRSPVLGRLKFALDSLCAHIGFSLCCTNESQEIRKNEAVTHPKHRGERDHQAHISIYKSPYPRHLSHRLNSEDPSDKHATREPYSWASVVTNEGTTDCPSRAPRTRGLT